MTMLRSIATTLIIVFSIQCLPARALTLDKNASWSGTINLSEDVIVPAEYTLTIYPGTRVNTNGNKIISYGLVNILGEKNNQVKFIALDQLLNSDIEVFKVAPYNIDTKILRDEFKVFRIQYAILWSVLFASMFVMLDAR